MTTSSSRLVLALPFLLDAASAVHGQETHQGESPCTAPEHRTFDHLLGDWIGTVLVPTDTGGFVQDTTVRVDVSFQHAVDGCGLLAHRVVHRQGRVTSRVVTLRGYDPSLDRWYQLAVSSYPTTLLFKVANSGADWTFTTRQPTADGGTESVRVTERQKPFGFDRVIEISDDGGNRWRLLDVVEFRRAPEVSPGAAPFR